MKSGYSGDVIISGNNEKNPEKAYWRRLIRWGTKRLLVAMVVPAPFDTEDLSAPGDTVENIVCASSNVGISTLCQSAENERIRNSNFCIGCTMHHVQMAMPPKPMEVKLKSSSPPCSALPESPWFSFQWNSGALMMGTGLGSVNPAVQVAHDYRLAVYEFTS